MQRFSSRRRRMRQRPAEISLTPLIDTALTLLIIFMITAPMIRNGIVVELPSGKVQEITQDTPQLLVQIDKEGKLFFDGDPYKDRASLIKALHTTSRAKNIKMVVVEGDRSSDYGLVYEFVDEVKGLEGIDYVAMSSCRA